MMDLLHTMILICGAIASFVIGGLLGMAFACLLSRSETRDFRCREARQVIRDAIRKGLILPPDAQRSRINSAPAAAKEDEESE